MENMMQCQRCNSKRIVGVSVKCSDLFHASLGDNEYDGYVPDDLGIGDGDYVEFDYCLECGQLQGNFPMGFSAIEKEVSREDVLNFFHNNFSEGEKISNLSKSYRRTITNEARDILGHKFSNFLYYFFENNEKEKFPSAEKFITMFLDNSPYIEEVE